VAKFVKGDVVVVPFVLYRIGNLKKDKLNEIIEKIIEIVRG